MLYASHLLSAPVVSAGYVTSTQFFKHNATNSTAEWIDGFTSVMDRVLHLRGLFSPLSGCRRFRRLAADRGVTTDSARAAWFDE
jgi:hypothetical protein